ncbi:MAG TPA: fatty acid desaturase, partial [Polyangiaceae bacterium]|nr:fatty acid desaturase [Polyangiaceae bacterium]
HEHNVMHHAHTGEEDDPDLIERNVAWVHDLPLPLRWGMLALLATTWRATYYAPATAAALLERDGVAPSGRALWAKVALESYVPYGAVMFGALPLAYLPLGPLAVGSALANSVLADVLTNLHTFVVVGPNHAGSDLHRYDSRPRSRGEHFARQVLGSTNYATGGDVVDFAHLWLNYQIEHHLFPDVPMLQYRKVQPKVKALCEKYGIPYTQESVARRFAKMARIFVGTEKMRRVEAPAHEPAGEPAGLEQRP